MTSKPEQKLPKLRVVKCTGCKATWKQMSDPGPEPYHSWACRLIHQKKMKWSDEVSLHKRAPSSISY